MQRGIINITKKIKLCLLLALLCLGIPMTMWARAIPLPEKTINGIRYWFLPTTPNKYSSSQRGIPDLRNFGFTVNPENEETYIAPDGRIVPKFDGGWWVESFKTRNDWYDPTDPKGPDTYSGDIFICDSIAIRKQVLIDPVEGKYEGRDIFHYVFGFVPEPMAEKLTSIRTPLYAKICTAHFRYAVNLKKVQIGACYAVEPFAFMNCAKLVTVIFEKAPFVCDDAFTDCVGIKTVVLQSEKELPYLEAATAFEESVYENATLYLPDELMDECAADPVWSRFVRIRSLKEYNLGVIVSTLISKLLQLV